MTQNEELDKIFFVTFCMGQYKHEHNMTGKEVADLFSQQGALRLIWKKISKFSTYKAASD